MMLCAGVAVLVLLLQAAADAVCYSYTLMSNEQLIPIRASTMDVKVRVDCSSHVTRHTSHVTRHTSHVTRHTPHATHPPQPVTRPPQTKIDRMNAQASEVSGGSVSAVVAAKAASKLLAAKARAPANL